MKKMLILGLTLVLTGSALTYADDIFPPPWRGHERWTYAQWEFNNPGDPTLPPGHYSQPDQWQNPFGPPTVNVFPGPGMEWMPEYEGRPGVWPLSGEMEFVILNFPEPLPEKRIWVQVTFQNQPGGTGGILESNPPSASWETISFITLPDGWLHQTIEIVIRPNPEFEVLRLFGDINVDEVVIDTICIPEPASLSLLALTAPLALLRRRRR